MAVSPSQSVANQIRHKQLGVNAGGAQGRLATVHKGVGLNPSSGGMNARGSGVAPVPAGAAPPRSSAPARTGFVPSGTAAPSAAPRPPRRARSAASMVHAVTGSVGHAAAPAAQTAVPDASTPAAGVPGPLDYRTQSGYINNMAQIGLSYGNQRQSIQDQLADNARQYGVQTGNDHRQAALDFQHETNDMNHAGLLRSGTRETGEADIARGYDQHMADLEQQYGSGATSRLNQALSQLADQEKLDRAGVESNAVDSYNSLYPSQPVADAPVTPGTPAPAPAAGVGAHSATSQYLRVRVSDGKGGWLVKPMLRSKMAPAQLQAALKSNLNR